MYKPRRAVYRERFQRLEEERMKKKKRGQVWQKRMLEDEDARLSKVFDKIVQRRVKDIPKCTPKITQGNVVWCCSYLTTALIFERIHCLPSPQERVCT